MSYSQIDVRSAKLPKRPEFNCLTIRQRAFLAAYVRCSCIAHAAKHVGINRERHHEWLHQDPQYQAAWPIAKEIAGDALEDEATRRAMLGVERLVVQGGHLIEVPLRDEQGEIVFDEPQIQRDKDGKPLLDADGHPIMVQLPKMVALTETLYSDRLMERLLEATKPEKYARRSQITGTLDIGIAQAIRQARAERLARESAPSEVRGTPQPAIEGAPRK